MSDIQEKKEIRVPIDFSKVKDYKQFITETREDGTEITDEVTKAIGIYMIRCGFPEITGDLFELYTRTLIHDKIIGCILTAKTSEDGELQPFIIGYSEYKKRSGMKIVNGLQVNRKEFLNTLFEVAKSDITKSVQSRNSKENER